MRNISRNIAQNISSINGDDSRLIKNRHYEKCSLVKAGGYGADIEHPFESACHIRLLTQLIASYYPNTS